MGVHSQALHHPLEEIAQRGDVRIGGDAADAWVVEDVNGAEVGQPVGHRPPERRPSASAGGGRREASAHQRVGHETLNTTTIYAPWTATKKVPSIV